MTDNTDFDNGFNKLSPFNIATAITVVALHGGVATTLANMEPIPLPEVKQEESVPIEIELVTIAEKPPEPVDIEPEPLVPESPASEPPAPESPEPIEPESSEPESSEPESIEPESIEPESIEPEPPALKSTTPVLTTNTEVLGQWEVPNSPKTTGQTETSGHSTISESSAPPAPPTPPAPPAPPTPPAPPAPPAPPPAPPAPPGPQNYSAGEANWVYKPTPSFSERVNRGLRSGERLSAVITITVDKQGNISNVQLASSSGNRVFDREAMQAMRQAKFSPHTVNGVPVVGIVNVPVNYIKP